MVVLSIHGALLLRRSDLSLHWRNQGDGIWNYAQRENGGVQDRRCLLHRTETGANIGTFLNPVSLASYTTASSGTFFPNHNASNLLGLALICPFFVRLAISTLTAFLPTRLPLSQLTATQRISDGDDIS